MLILTLIIKTFRNYFENGGWEIPAITQISKLYWNIGTLIALFLFHSMSQMTWLYEVELLHSGEIIQKKYFKNLFFIQFYMMRNVRERDRILE